MYKLSIVIPIFNNWLFTLNALNNLIKLDKDNFEIIIVDNASADETHHGMSQFLDQSNLKYIRNAENEFFGKACNKGYFASQGTSVLFLNNDVKFLGDYIKWFDDLVSQLELNNNCLISPTGGFVDPNKNFKFEYETNNAKEKFNYLSGWNISSNKETFNKLAIKDQLGPFDSETYKLYFEDTDLSFRATQQKIKLLMFPCPLVHIGKQTSKKINGSKYFQESQKQFIKKWKNKL